MKTSTDFAKYLSRFLSEYLPHHRNLSPNTTKSYTATFALDKVFRLADNFPLSK